MFTNNFAQKIIDFSKMLRSRKLFFALEEFCRGDVLDIGGWAFFVRAAGDPKINFKSWTNLEPDSAHVPAISDPRYRLVIGDGCAMDFPDESFDTILNFQVLEHVFDPIAMMNEIGRVLTQGGRAIFLIPQTSVLHHAPDHYYNFTRYWIYRAAEQAGLEIIKLQPVGGRWTTFASHLVHFFFEAFRAPGYSMPENKRNLWFYLLFPFMALYAIVGVPICMFFSLGDLDEDPNNYVVVATKR